MFPVMSRLDEHFGFDYLFFACPIGRELTAQKDGCLERNFPTPVKTFFPEMNSELSNIQQAASQKKTFQIFNSWVLNTALYFEMYRSIRSQMLFKKGVLKNFTIFTGKNQFWSLFLVKLQAFRTATLFKRNSNTGVFL